MSDAVTDPERSQSIDFGEGAQGDQVLVAFQQIQAVGISGIIHKMTVGFVQDDEHMGTEPYP